MEASSIQSDAADRCIAGKFGNASGGGEETEDGQASAGSQAVGGCRVEEHRANQHLLRVSPEPAATPPVFLGPQRNAVFAPRRLQASCG